MLLRSVLAAILVLTSTIMGGGYASAYTFIGCRWTVYNPSYTDQSSYYAHSEVTSAASSWGPGTHITLVEISGSPNINVAAGNYGADNNPGHTSFQPCILSGSTYYFQSGTWSVFNTYYTDAYQSLEKQAVMAHELGHALGLGHQSGPICYPPIMYPTMAFYESCGLYIPQPDDINGINALYP